MPNDAAEVRRHSPAHVLLDAAADLGAPTILLPADVEHHLRRVLRLRVGDVVSVTDGGGRWCTGRLREVGETTVVEADGDVHVEPRAAPFTLAVSVPKGDRVDWLVQKTTELGVDRIVLIQAERSVVRWRPDRAATHLRRLQKIADEATRQSRRVWRPVVSGPLPALDVLADAVLAEPGGSPVRGDEGTIAIGPEGGWSDAELAASDRRVRLGANILRVETAAVAATTLRMVGHHGTGAFPSSHK